MTSRNQGLIYASLIVVGIVAVVGYAKFLGPAPIQSGVVQEEQAASSTDAPASDAEPRPPEETSSGAKPPAQVPEPATAQ